METAIFNLKLASSIYFETRKEANPFTAGEDIINDCGKNAGEKLFCLELDEKEYLKFEPDKDKLVKNAEGAKELPQGDYLFTQKREVLNRQEIVNLAVEIQSEGLWQRLEPGKKLYLRYLFEDGKFVTQLYRPYSRTASTM